MRVTFAELEDQDDCNASRMCRLWIVLRTSYPASEYLCDIQLVLVSYRVRGRPFWCTVVLYIRELARDVLPVNIRPSFPSSKKKKQRKIYVYIYIYYYIYYIRIFIYL